MEGGNFCRVLTPDTKLEATNDCWDKEVLAPSKDEPPC